MCLLEAEPFLAFGLIWDTKKTNWTPYHLKRCKGIFVLLKLSSKSVCWIASNYTESGSMNQSGNGTFACMNRLSVKIKLFKTLEFWALVKESKYQFSENICFYGTNFHMFYYGTNQVSANTLNILCISFIIFLVKRIITGTLLFSLLLCVEQWSFFIEFVAKTLYCRDLI